MHRVELYGRAGCCLCDDALQMLVTLRRDHAFELIEHDIEDDECLLRRYLERIPVIVIDGKEAFELLIEEHQLAARLAVE